MAAKKAIFALWERRSDIGLLGYEIDVETGEWSMNLATIGAGTDSFFEYLLKGHILFGDPDLLYIYGKMKEAVMKHLPDQYGNYRMVQSQSGRVLSGRSDALGAFWPGLLVLEGDIDNALSAFTAFYLRAHKYGDGLLPEAIDLDSRAPVNHDYHLRPELVESAFYLYQATRHPFFKRYAIKMMNAIEARCRTKCGYAGLKIASDAHSKVDRMESFLLSETFKYIYLLLDEEHWLNKDGDAVVFSTEAHPLKIPLGLEPHWPVFRTTLACKRFSGLDYGQVLIQSWNAGLKWKSVDQFLKQFKSNDLNQPASTTPTTLMKYHETAVLPHPNLIHIKGAPLMTATNLTLFAWPGIQDPEYWASIFDGTISSNSSQEITLITRKPSGLVLYDPMFVRYFIEDNKCPSLLEVRHSRVTSAQELIGKYGEDMTRIVYGGLLIRNLKSTVLPDYIFDKLRYDILNVN